MEKCFFIDNDNTIIKKSDNTFIWLNKDKEVITDNICGVFRQLIFDTDNIELISRAKSALLYFEEEKE